MALKTLDEIDWIQKDVDGTIIATNTKALRQEAIKDIKELEKYKLCPVCGKRYTGKGLSKRNHEVNFHCESCKCTWYENGKPQIIDYIKAKFNISEDDLNESKRH